MKRRKPYPRTTSKIDFASKYRPSNQGHIKFEANKISPPNCRWVELRNFKLEEIPRTFEPTDYQRVINKRHTYQIVQSIVNNTFYDNTIRIVKSGEHIFHVIDGQHRLAALWILHTQYGLEKYDLSVQIFKAHEQREVYRKINSGRGLTPANILKTYDLPGVTFFEELRDYATHNKSVRKVSFLGLLQCIHYSRGKTKVTGPDTFERFLKEITSDELAHTVRISKATTEVYSILQSSRIFQDSFLRMIFCIGVENNFMTDEYKKSFLKLIADEELRKIHKEGIILRWDEAMNMARRIIGVATR